MKNIIKRIFIITSLALLISTPSLAKSWKTIRIGVEGAYPPFSKTEPNGEVSGFDIDIANAICKEINAKCTIIKQDWDGMIPALIARRYDAIIASMSITDERKKKVNFTKKYYSAPATFVGKKGANISIRKPSLKGKRIGVQGETIMDKYLTDNYGDVVKIVRYGTQEEVNLDLSANRLDMMFAEIAPADEFLTTKAGRKFRFFGNFISDKKWFGEGIGIAVRKKDDDLRRKLNKAIKAIRANGVYDDIQYSYFDYDIYGD